MSFVGEQVVKRPSIGVGLIGLFVCIGALCVRAVWQLTFHPVLQALASWLSVSIGIRHIGHITPFQGIADAIDRLDHSVYHGLSNGIKWGGNHFVHLVLWIAYTVTMIGVAIGAITYELLLGLKLIHRRTEPSFVQKSVAPLVKPLHHTAAKTAAITDTHIPAIEKTIAGLRARLNAQQAELDQVKSVAIPAPIAYPGQPARREPVPVPAPVPRTLPRVSDLSDAVGTIRGQLKRVAKVLTPAGIIGLVGAAVFTRFDLGWLRCKGVGRVGRALCGASSMIEALAAGAITAFAVTDLCRFAYGIERVAEDVRPALLGFVDVENALFKCSSASYPGPLVIAAVSPTPVFDAVAL